MTKKKMSPMEIWCNESQERYVLAIKNESVSLFSAICEKERAPFSILGEATENPHLSLEDAYFNNKPIDIEMNLLFGSSPKTLKDVKSILNNEPEFNNTEIKLDEAINRLLRLPAVASKKFLLATVGNLNRRLMASSSLISVLLNSGSLFTIDLTSLSVFGLDPNNKVISISIGSLLK